MSSEEQNKELKELRERMKQLEKEVEMIYIYPGQLDHGTIYTVNMYNIYVLDCFCIFS